MGDRVLVGVEGLAVARRWSRGLGEERAGGYRLGPGEGAMEHVLYELERSGECVRFELERERAPRAG